MTNAELEDLLVVHQLKDAAGQGMPEKVADRLRTQGLYIDTCLRQLCILSSRDADIDYGEHLRGAHAYSFLLQTITGLNSSVPGETNVQGQFRCAWKRWRKIAPAEQVWRLNQLMPALLADSKHIRRTYLQNLGGASYGSLTRKLLQPERDAHILFLGAGNFSRSMLPMFSNWETGLWNHRLHKGLQTNARIFEPTDITGAAIWATHIVVTTPPDNDIDEPWVQLTRQHNIQHMVHLGRRRAQHGCWKTLIGDLKFHDLDDVFDLRRSQATLRNLHTLRARRACERIAHTQDSSDLLADGLLPQSA